MTQADRLRQEFKACRGPFPYTRLVSLLGKIGYVDETGNGGSSRLFVHSTTRLIIRLHAPHPQKEVKAYVVREIRRLLTERNEL